MPRSSNAVVALLGNPVTVDKVDRFVFDSAAAASVSAALLTDARDHYYSALISFVEAIRGINEGFYSWSVVKFYYSTFYSIQSLLASEFLGVVYVTFDTSQKKGKPFSFSAVAGQQLKGVRISSSHEFVFKQFEKNFPNHFLNSSQIAGENAFDWLRTLRESVNYKESPFSEPEAPSCMKIVATHSVRDCIATYIKERQGLYVFDADHAMLAFPLRSLTFAFERCKLSGASALREEQMGFLLKICKDKNGLLSRLIEFSEL